MTYSLQRKIKFTITKYNENYVPGRKSKNKKEN